MYAQASDTLSDTSSVQKSLPLGGRHRDAFFHTRRSGPRRYRCALKETTDQLTSVQLSQLRAVPYVNSGPRLESAPPGSSILYKWAFWSSSGAELAANPEGGVSLPETRAPRASAVFLPVGIDVLVRHVGFLMSKRVWCGVGRTPSGLLINPYLAIVYMIWDFSGI